MFIRRKWKTTQSLEQTARMIGRDKWWTPRDYMPRLRRETLDRRLPSRFCQHPTPANLHRPPSLRPGSRLAAAPPPRLRQSTARSRPPVHASLDYIPCRCYSRRRRSPAGPTAMTADAFPSPAAPKKRGPKTPRARPALDERQAHGLRARKFGILPEEDQAEWAQHLEELRVLRAGRRHRGQAGRGARGGDVEGDPRRPRRRGDERDPAFGPGRSHGTDLQEPRHAVSLNTAIRYTTAAAMATQRAQRPSSPIARPGATD